MRRSSSYRARSSHRRRNNSPEWGKITALTLLPILAIAAGLLAFKSMLGRTEPIAGTHCFEQADQYQSAMLIDFSMTADNSASQMQDLKTAMRNAYNRLPANGRLSIFTTARNSAGGDLAVADIFVCRPASTKDEQETIQGRSDTLPVIRKQALQARDEFDALIDQVVQDSQDSTKTALYSPLLESIQSISRYYDTGTLDHFTLYSDGVQNSETLQFCKTKGHLPPYPLFTRLEQYQDIKPAPFTGTQVDILLVESIEFPSAFAPYCTNRELRDFYPAFFGGHGASTQLTRIRYGASS